MQGSRWCASALFALASVAAGAVLAQVQPIPGDVVSLGGDDLRIKTAKGELLDVHLAGNARITGRGPADWSKVTPGVFLGATAKPQSDGTLVASEVHIFPEAMRGTGEGHRPWDLQPNSTMTNATVEQVTAVGDHQITLKYKDGEKKIVVGPECPIVSYAPGNLADLKPGAKIFIGAATRQADGTLSVPRINVGRDAAPPM
jgi:hypothetical protein